MNTIAVYLDAWSDSVSIKPTNKNLLALYKFGVWYKSNPKSREYMLGMVKERYPNVEILEFPFCEKDTALLREADEVILLYPDAIGLGFGAVEKFIVGIKKPETAIKVLNGRKRFFLFNLKIRRQLRRRRFLEWTMLPELIFMVFFVIFTPFMYLFDAMRKRF